MVQMQNCPIAVWADLARHNSSGYGTSRRRQAFSSAAQEGCAGRKNRDTVAMARPSPPFCQDLLPASHGRPGTPSNGRTTGRSRSRSESNGGLTKARCEE
jgi:hypothetical protein